ncbi:hypothetical protein QVD17_09429 [Tagetes erecta]|uniref:AP2/ERF domain-containing protein n=1 Tax=Tagetes erecta TaxID=13708 RepID=A0AAD8L0K8_TARER|nr:hypothetical protein QVD17_09429 [Tagetes erecta]
MTNEEYIAFLRRKSSGFSRGVSKYRGVARHHHNGRWEARIGRVNGNKYIYLGTYATEEEAAKAYDLAAIKFRGTNTVTNFDISNYSENMDAPDDSPPSKDELNDDMKPKPQEDELNDDMKPKPQEDEGQLSEIQNLKFEQDNPWSLSMELGYSYTPHVFSDDPFDKSGDHLDLFNDHGFEANIDSIFSKPVSNNGCATSTSSPLFSSSPRMSFGA